MADDLKDLIDRARDGDATAFQTLYERFSERVYALCQHLLGDPEAAVDATQETFVNAWEQLRRLRHSEAFWSWLRATAVNACRHHRRRRRWLSGWSEQSAEDDPSEAADPREGGAERLARAELQARVREALGRLSPAHREVVVLHHFEGLPLAEIAALLGVATGTVKSRLGRAREHLERLLGPYLEE